jgi:hypothetical protein
MTYVTCPPVHRHLWVLCNEQACYHCSAVLATCDPVPFTTCSAGAGADLQSMEDEDGLGLLELALADGQLRSLPLLISMGVLWQPDMRDLRHCYDAQVRWPCAGCRWMPELSIQHSLLACNPMLT